MKSLKKVPTLRFNKIRDNKYSEWELVSLGEVAEIVGGGTPPTEKVEYWNGDIQWFTPTEISSEKYVSKSKRTISSEGLKNSSAKTLPIGTILLTTRASLGDMAILLNEATTNQGFQSLIVRSNAINEFIYYLQPKIKRYCNKNASGSTFLEISKANLAKMTFYLPSLQEQQKIADFFTLLDRRIEKQGEKVEALRDYKKGMLQKIFSRELRFKDENGEEFPEWEERLLGDCSEVTTGNKDTKDKIDDGEYPFFVRSSIVEKINSFSFDGEAILTAGDGVGVGKVFHYINGKFDFHQRVYMLCNFQNCDGKYIYYYFSMNFLKEAMKYNAKTSVDSVRREMITKMLIPFPHLQEQQKIADFLSKLDVKIEKEEAKLEALQEQKKGFMQQMFV